MKKLRETDIVRACLEYLAARKIMAWRSNSGAVKATYGGKTRFVRFNSAKGMSDICAILPGGRFCAIEVKRPGGKMTEDQERFQDDVERSGGYAIMVTSVDELMGFIEGVRVPF